MKTITKRLEKVRSQRSQGRRSRQKADVPTVSLVGYTNAGKSTLFNSMTQADVYTADQLFATLDPTLRQVKVPNIGPAILVDTVGFIRHLPHDLVNAFRATLEETQEAELLVHVQDITSQDQREHSEQVLQVLDEIDAGDIPQLQVYNKIDLLADFEPRCERNHAGVIKRVWVSAKTGAGLDLLWQALTENLADEIVYKLVQIKPTQGKLRAHLYSLGCVIEERTDDEGKTFLYVKMARRDYEKLITG